MVGTTESVYEKENPQQRIVVIKVMHTVHTPDTMKTMNQQMLTSCDTTLRESTQATELCKVCDEVKMSPIENENTACPIDHVHLFDNACLELYKAAETSPLELYPRISGIVTSIHDHGEALQDNISKIDRNKPIQCYVVLRWSVDMKIQLDDGNARSFSICIVQQV